MDNINGYVKHYATAPDQTYIYPVGSGSDLRFLAISGTIAAAGVYATVWIVGDPTTTMDPTTPNAGLHPVTSVAPGISIVSTSGQWDWQDVSGNAAGVTITVSIPDMTNFATASNLRLAGWAGTQWVDLSGTATASSNIENSLVTGIMQAGITAVAIASITTILPVVLQSFNTTMKICDALSLNWSVSDANNFSYFEVERSSDGRAYTVEAKISYDPSKSTYTFSNHGLLQGNYYYRLKMVDKDGASKYGNTVSVKVNCALSQILVYPNPVLHTVTVRGLKGKENLQLFNAVGQRLLNVNANGYQFDINMSTYIRGIYTLYINTKNGEKVVIKKIVKVGR